MFTYKLIFSTATTTQLTEYEIHPTNESEITFSYENQPYPCVGYSRSIDATIDLDINKIIEDGIEELFDTNIIKNINTKNTIRVYDGTILYYTGVFTGKNLTVNNYDNSYKIELTTFDEYYSFNYLSSDKINLYDAIGSGVNIEDENNYIFNQEIKGCYKLIDVLNYFVDTVFSRSILGQQYTLESSFFTDQINQISSIDGDTNSLYLVFVSNAIKSLSVDSYDQAIKSEITFEQLLKDLNKLFNDVVWYIDKESNKFILEHWNTIYDNRETGTDLTIAPNQQYTSEQKTYAFNTVEIPRIERYTTSARKYKEFDDQTYEYENDSDKEDLHSLDGYTDLIGLDIDQSAYNDENYFIVKCESNTAPIYIHHTDLEFLDYNDFTFIADDRNNGQLTTENRFNYFNVTDIASPTNTNEWEYVMSERFSITAGEEISINGRLNISTNPLALQSWIDYLKDDKNATVYEDDYYPYYLLGSGNTFFTKDNEVIRIVLINNDVNSNGSYTQASTSFVNIQNSALTIKSRYDYTYNIDEVLTASDTIADCRILFMMRSRGDYQYIWGYYKNQRPAIEDILKYSINIGIKDITADLEIRSDLTYSAINYDLSWKRLMQTSYFKSNRYDDTMLFSGTKQYLRSNSLVKQKTGISTIQIEDVTSFEENKYIKSNVGDLGILKNAKYDPTTKSLDLNVVYDIAERNSREREITNISFDGLKSFNIEDSGIAGYDGTGEPRLILKTVYIEVSLSTDITAITPIITISNYATLSPSTGIEQDFTNNVEYLVTAENGLKTLYKFIVYKSDLKVVYSGDSSGLPGANIATIKATSPIDIRYTCPITSPDTTSFTSTISSSVAITSISGTDYAIFRLSDHTKVYSLSFNLFLGGGNIDISEFSNLTELFIASNTQVVSSIQLPTTSTVWTSISIKDITIGVIDWNKFEGTSNNVNINLRDNEMTEREVDQNLLELANKGWTGMTVTIDNNTIPEYRIAFTSIVSGGSGYLEGDILSFTGGAGSGAQLRVTSIGGSGDITGVIIESSGRDYSTDPTGISGGTGTSASITGYTAKSYLISVLSATVTTD